MPVLVALIGVVLAGMGAVCLVAPDRFRRLLSVWKRRLWINVGILLRLLIGIVLIAGARQTGLPTFIMVLGIVTLVAALITPLLGYDRLFAFADWWAARPNGLVRVWAVLAMALGVAVLYAAL